MNIILDILSRQPHIPPVLYLQLDNTARENKNQYLLAFLAFMVEQKVFTEVITLIHTHIVAYTHTHTHIMVTFCLKLQG